MSPGPGRLRDGTKYVIGCVSGAHHQLIAKCEAAGIEAPDYDWCEDQWRGGLSKTLAAQVGTKAMPACLTAELDRRWLGVFAGCRAHGSQLELFGEVSR